MNIKASYWYQMLDHKKAILIYYFVLVCMITVNFLFSLFSPGIIIITGIEGVTAIFLFVAGLCSFKENFGMLLQNSFSRKSMFAGRLLTSVSIALIMALCDKVMIAVSNLLFAKQHFTLVDTFTQGYLQKHPDMSSFAILVSSFLFSFTLYLSILAVGYMITLLFFRLGKSGKIAVGVGVPVIWCIFRPMVDDFFFQGRFTAAITAFLDSAYGISSGKVQNAIFTSIALFIAFSLIDWLLMKKAIVQK